jgi:hypothetical protein
VLDNGDFDVVNGPSGGKPPGKTASRPSGGWLTWDEVPDPDEGPEVVPEGLAPSGNPEDPHPCDGLHVQIGT